MKNKTLKILLSSSVLATTAIPVVTTTSCAQNTGMTGEWFEDLPEVAGCPYDECELPNADAFELKKDANDFGGFSKSEPEWFQDETCTQPITNTTQIPDGQPGELTWYAKVNITFTKAGYKPTFIVKPLKVKIITTEASDFQTDEWCTLVRHAEQGLDHLKKAYGKTSFVGLQRKLLINGLEHRVRVIGENHDNLSSPQSDIKKATLTFEFIDLLSYKDNEKGKIYCKSYGWRDYENYYTDLGSTISNMLQLFPIVIKNNIKQVKKGVYLTKDPAIYPSSGWHVEEFNLHLFVLSTNEMTGSSGIADGSRYAWYQTHSSNNDRIKKDLANDAMTYWTRTPHPCSGYMDPSDGWYVNKKGEVVHTGLLDWTDNRCVALAFCL